MESARCRCKNVTLVAVVPVKFQGPAAVVARSISNSVSLFELSCQLSVTDAERHRSHRQVRRRGRRHDGRRECGCARLRADGRIVAGVIVSLDRVAILRARGQPVVRKPGPGSLPDQHPSAKYQIACQPGPPESVLGVQDNVICEEESTRAVTPLDAAGAEAPPVADTPIVVVAHTDAPSGESLPATSTATI